MSVGRKNRKAHAKPRHSGHVDLHASTHGGLGEDDKSRRLRRPVIKDSSPAGRDASHKIPNKSVTTSFKLDITARQGKKLAPFLHRHLCAARSLIKADLQELSLALVGDADMIEVHEHFLGIAKPTDVLSFELEYNQDDAVTVGEVIVCVPQARRQKRGGKWEEEVLLCALHGMLHLCGFDDRTERGFIAMHRAEDDILIRLGLPPVFSRGGRK
jgi:probable rRNA maturation factor